MKLNSKLPILLIGCTTLLFLGISISNENDKPQIETIRGYISDLDGVNINSKEYESSLYYDVTHTINSNNEVVTKKEKKFDKGLNEQKYVELMDISCGQDYISHVGYEIDFSKDKNEITFIVDERKSNIGSHILENQGKDVLISNNEIDFDNIERTKVELKYPNISLEIESTYILGSYRYKNDLYIISNYTSENADTVYGKNYIVISKLDKENKQLQEVGSIDLKDKVTMFDYLSVADITRYNEKIYALIMSNKYDDDNNVGDEFYLLEYDLDKGESLVNKIDIARPYHFATTYFESNVLNLVLADTRKDVEVVNIQYNVITKEKIDEFKIVVEYYKENKNQRIIDSAIIKNDNIYITVKDNSNYGTYRSDCSIYVIDIDNRCITYEGKILGSEFIELK